MGRPPDQTCDSCGEVMSGYTRAELEADGWIWHATSKRVVGKLHPVSGSFVMCSECCDIYAKRRKAKESR